FEYVLRPELRALLHSAHPFAIEYWTTVGTFAESKITRPLPAPTSCNPEIIAEKDLRARCGEQSRGGADRSDAGRTEGREGAKGGRFASPDYARLRRRRVSESPVRPVAPPP